MKVHKLNLNNKYILRYVLVIVTVLICIMCAYVSNIELPWILPSNKSFLETAYEVTQSNAYDNRKLKWEDFLKCQQQRLTRLQERCSKMSLVPELPLHKRDEKDLKDMTSNYLTDDLHHISMYAIPKTGCSSWKTLLIQSATRNLTEKRPYISPHSIYATYSGLYRLGRYNKVAILQRLSSYLIALTVRHPFTRLESGFKGKVLALRRQTSEAVKALEFDKVTLELEEFIENYILRFKKNMVDAHFKSVFDLANPCTIPINFIGRTETANIDMEYLAENKLYAPVKSLHKNIMHKLSVDREDGENGEIYLPLLSMVKDVNTTVNKLMEVYGKDMRLFGYRYEIREDGVYAMCESGDSVNNMCC